MNGLVLLKTINFISAILAVLTYFCSFEFLPGVKWGMLGLVLVLSGVLFFVRKLYELDYDTFLDEAKKGYAVMGLLVLLSIYKEDYRGALNGISPYVLIYLVSSITVLRLQRQKQNAGENKLISRLNYIYSFLLILVAFVLGEEHSRAYIGKMLAVAWRAVPDFVVKASYALWFFIMSILAKPFVWLVSLLKGKKLEVDDLGKRFGRGKPRFNFEDPYVDKVSAFLNNNFVRFIIWSLIISLVVYLIFKIFQKGRVKRKYTESYEEEKEFLIGEKREKSGLLKRALERMKPKENNQIIRYYYLKFLKRCIKRQIEIKSGDTSADVNRKSGVEPQQMEVIRDTYIKVRYSDYCATKEEVRDFSKRIREIPPVE